MVLQKNLTTDQNANLNRKAFIPSLYQPVRKTIKLRSMYNYNGTPSKPLTRVRQNKATRKTIQSHTKRKEKNKEKTTTNKLVFMQRRGFHT